MLDVGLGILSFAVAAGLVDGLSRLFRLRLDRPRFDDPRRAAMWGLLAVLVGWILVSALLLAVSPADREEPPAENEIMAHTHGFNDVLSHAFMALIGFGPIVVFMRRRREGWSSAGVTRRNLAGSVVLGLFFGIVTTVAVVFFADEGSDGALVRIEASHLWAFLTYAIVGFGEEFAYRGFLQTRLEAWLGWWQGWIAASVLMALGHLVQRVAVLGLPPAEALASCLGLIPISLLMGWIMLRTRNVAAPGIVHTFANWVNTLF